MTEKEVIGECLKNIFEISNIVRTDKLEKTAKYLLIKYKESLKSDFTTLGLVKKQEFTENWSEM